MVFKACLDRCQDMAVGISKAKSDSDKGGRADTRRFRELLGEESWEGWVGFLREAAEGFGTECFRILSSFRAAPGMGFHVIIVLPPAQHQYPLQ